MPPERPDLVLATDIPNRKTDVLVLDCLHIEADGRYGGRYLAQLQLVKDGGLARSVQANHENPQIGTLLKHALEASHELPSPIGPRWRATDDRSRGAAPTKRVGTEPLGRRCFCDRWHGRRTSPEPRAARREGPAVLVLGGEPLAGRGTRLEPPLRAPASPARGSSGLRSLPRTSCDETEAVAATRDAVDEGSVRLPSSSRHSRRILAPGIGSLIGRLPCG
mmetsp:Transcript_51103/g.165410  ORF Transcript_51103/g.165410 Transcript_51103/m.165410 type:complete len:221 (-) Transcript_51103:1512-2174(-)